MVCLCNDACVKVDLNYVMITSCFIKQMQDRRVGTVTYDWSVVKKNLKVELKFASEETGVPSARTAFGTIVTRRSSADKLATQNQVKLSPPQHGYRNTDWEPDLSP